jgi:hypothetical protein
MSRDRTKAQQDPRSNPARLPALHNPVVSDPVSLGNFLLAVKEILEVLTGARGSGYDKVVTHRELIDLGLGGVDFVTGRVLTTRPREPNTGELLIKTPGGFYSTISAAEFAAKLRSTKLFQDLIKSLDDPARFDDFPERVKAILLPSIAAEARARGAEIRRLESTLQTTRESLASVVQEVTASVNNAAAGVRETVFAYANQNKAVAGKVTQLEVRLDDVDGQGVKIEEVLYGKADNSGLMGQWTLKMNAGGAIAGVGLSATDNEAGPDSAFIVMANRFAVVSPSYTGGLTTDPDNMYIPFGVDSSGAYVNGSLRVNASGPTLNELANAKTLALSYTSEFFKVNADGSPVNTSIQLTANLKGITGYVTWSASPGYSGAIPVNDNTWTIPASDQTADAVTYTATITDGSDTYTDSVTLVRLRDGSSSLTAILTNEAMALPCDSAGNVQSFSGASGSMRVYRGATLLTSGVTYAIQSNPDGLTATISSSGEYSVTGEGSWPTGAGITSLIFRATVDGVNLDKQFTLTKARSGVNGLSGVNAYSVRLSATSQIFQTNKDGSVTPSSITLSAFQQNLDSLGPVTYTFETDPPVTLSGSGGVRTLTTAAMGSNQAVKVTVTASAGSETVSDTITLVRVREGSDAVTGYLSNESHSLPANASGVVASYIDAGGNFKVYRGGVDVSASCTFSYVSSTGFSTAPTASINAGTGAYAVTGSGSGGVISNSADVATVTYRATYTFGGVTTTIDRVFTITKAKQGATGANGTRGTVSVSRAVSLTSWTTTGTTNGNTEAAAAIAAAGYGTPIERDQVTLYNTAAKWSETRFYSGGTWQSIAMYVGGNVFIDGTIAASKLTAGTVYTQTSEGYAGLGTQPTNWSGNPTGLAVPLWAARTSSNRPSLSVSDGSGASLPSTYWNAEIHSRGNGLMLDFGRGITVGMSAVGMRMNGSGSHGIWMEGSYSGAAMRIETAAGSADAGYALSASRLRTTGSTAAARITNAGPGPALEVSNATGVSAATEGAIVATGKGAPAVEAYGGGTLGTIYASNGSGPAARLNSSGSVWAPLILNPMSALPTNRQLGSLCVLTDGNLYFANGTHWYRVGGMVQVT